MKQRLELGGELGMACIWKKHILGGENNQYEYPKEEACLACLRSMSLKVYQEASEPAHIEPGQSWKRGQKSKRGLTV